MTMQSKPDNTASAAPADIKRALRAIAEGYPVCGEGDRYVVVENPDFKPDDGSGPNICIDIFALSASSATEAKAVAGCDYCVDGVQADGETPCPCQPSPPQELEELRAEVERLRSGNRYAQLEAIALRRAEAAEERLKLAEQDTRAKALEEAAQIAEKFKRKTVGVKSETWDPCGRWDRTYNYEEGRERDLIAAAIRARSLSAIKGDGSNG